MTVDPVHVALFTVLAPLLGFVIPALALQRQPRVATGVVLLGSVLSVCGALGLFWLSRDSQILIRADWLVSGSLTLQFGFFVDGVSGLFGLVVAVITLSIQAYSVGYMAHDPCRTRFFSLLSFFGWCMLSFVYSVNLLQTFIFWELVGLASFLLIGFWFEKPAAAAAANKAFVMTRIGDVGLFIGLILLLRETGSYDIPALLAVDPASLMAPQRLTLITLLIFVGIMGKSAQFPLHTWLPDAMEGPTPVSALLHSATMVAAGVFLMARLYPFMSASATTMTVVLAVALFTALLSATVAMVERDMKRVLAYSSISQLGFMLLGLAAGGYVAGVFHLVTHAFFKALLFLCAGAFIHHVGSNDLVSIGRLGGRSLRWTSAALVIGAGALAGLPPLAGFFSKEAILTTLHHYPWVLGGALVGSFLTAYYSFRMVFLVLRPNAIERPAPGNGDHGHGTPGVMLGPILFLAVCSVALGFGGSALAERLGSALPHAQLGALALAVVVAFSGVAVAWLDFGRRGAGEEGFVTRVPALHSFFAHGWYLDALYGATVVVMVKGVSVLCHFFETRGLDGGADLVGSGIIHSGESSARLQNGWLNLYLGTTALLVGLFILYLGVSW